MSTDFDTSVLLDEFLEDATGHLEAVESSLLELEKRTAAGESGKALVTLLLGNLHTLKGNAGMMGFASLQHYVHKLESAFKCVADDTIAPTANLFETFYTAVNALRGGLGALAENPSAPLDFSDELMALECLSHLTPEQAHDVVSLPTEALRSKTDDFGYITQKSTTLKVNFEKLDELLNLVGELVIHRTTLMALETRIKEQVTDRQLLEAFSESSQLIGKSSTDLREAIMKARMLPVRTVFQRFQRLVRDLSHRHGKQVQLLFEGEDTELDKTVIDEIGEPLLHLIRNAIDHGIESPAERKKSGKPATGTLTLRARHESNHIIIAVEDDGKGIDAGKIKSAAAAKGLLVGEDADSLDEGDILQFIFAPGFSTSREVTETSGRGIGLDVVKKIVTSFNGLIDVSSRPGHGTAFTIKLPLTLAIITALMVEVAGETFAIPLSGVLESIRIDNADIHDVGTGEMINLRDRLLPIHRLDRFFALPQAAERGQQYIVVVGSGEKRGGLVVDRLVGQQEIVIKGLDDYLGELPGISGGTVLGSGRISLILDIGSLLGEGR
ncbi:MAG TPA: chemotaxis protein CheA [Geobacteraceae bacterium]